MFVPQEELKDLTEAQLAENRKRFQWMVSFLICRYHFIHRILGMMKHIAVHIGTMGVNVIDGMTINLFFDPRMTYYLTDAELTYIFYHEVMHVALHHCDCRQNPDPLWGIAIDLEVNELIEEVLPDICKRPVHKDGSAAGQFVSEYKKDPKYKGILEKQTAEWYYDFLRKTVPPEQQAMMKLMQQLRQALGGQGGKPQPGQGEQPGDKLDMPGQSIDDHSGHKQNEVMAERVRAVIKEIGNSDSWGTMSQGLKETIKAAQIAKINWRNLIRNWFGAHAWKDREPTRKRPNRRTGYMFPGNRRSYVDKWLVAVDDSGSCWTPDILGEWVGVLNQLVEELPIDVMSFDADVTNQPHPYDRRRDHFEFTGGGGTSFDPVIKMADDRHYKGVMILTDGEAAKPTPPVRARVLWVLPKGKNPPVDWGDRVHLERHA